MRIVHCVFSLETGGLEIIAVDLINEMSKCHEVSLVIINEKVDQAILTLLAKKVKVYCLNRIEGSRNLIPFIKLNMLLLRLRPQVVHCHDSKIIRAIKVPTGKMIHTVHDMGIPVSHYGKYHSIVAISDSVSKDVSDRSNLAVTRIYNGVPVDRFTRRIDYARKPKAPIRMVQVSRLVHEKKGQDILLRAVRILIDKYGWESFQLDFIGIGKSLPVLLELTQSLRLEQHVYFAGERSRDWVYNNLSDYHIMIQPSRYEGFGLTIIEGLAAGIPVLASDIDGPAELIANLEGGFLFESDNAEACATALNNIITMYENNAVADLMIVTKHQINGFSLATCAEKYVAQYQKLAQVS